MEAIDLGALYFFSTHQVEPMTTLSLWLTTLGNFAFMAPLALGLCLVLARLRGGRTALLYATFVVLTFLLCWGTQWTVGRPRPDVRERVLPLPTAPSFPSGHATNSLLIFGLFGLLVTRGWPSTSRRWTFCLVFFLLAFLMGITRLYLAVHFVSDVVGGWMLALGLTLIALALDRSPQVTAPFDAPSP